MSGQKIKIFTGAITNSILTIDESDGVTMITLKVASSSSSSGSVLGNITLGSLQPTSITIIAGDGTTIATTNNGFIDGFTITAPSGCTINIIALR
tara:strand:+ start:660 stop:944 length:285 start_codon:yes stop_codon:yes gene_type:complete